MLIFFGFDTKNEEKLFSAQRGHDRGPSTKAAASMQCCDCHTVGDPNLVQHVKAYTDPFPQVPQEQCLLDARVKGRTGTQVCLEVRQQLEHVYLYFFCTTVSNLRILLEISNRNYLFLI